MLWLIFTLTKGTINLSIRAVMLIFRLVADVFYFVVGFFV